VNVAREPVELRDHERGPLLLRGAHRLAQHGTLLQRVASLAGLYFLVVLHELPAAGLDVLLNGRRLGLKAEAGLPLVCGPEGFEHPEAIAAHAQPDPNRVVGGTVRHTMGGANDGQVQSSEPVTRHQMGQPGQYAGASVAATYEDRYGKPSVMLPGGMRTGVEVAQRMGLIHKSADGRWVDSVPMDQQAATLQAKVTEAPQQPQQPQEVNHFDPRHARQLDTVIAGLPAHAVHGAQARLVALLANDTGSEAGIASQMAQMIPGMVPEQALQLVQQFQAVHADAVAAALGPLGMNADKANEFIAQLRESNRSRYQEAIQVLFYERSPRLFVAAAQDHILRNTTAKQNDAVLNPGKGPAGSAIPAIRSSDTATHEAFERAGYSIGTFQNEMFVSKGDGQWVRASEAIGHMLSKVK
jgi:hypothetical protein